MSVLITGANGSIGTDLVNILSNNHKVYGIYRTNNKKIKKIKNVAWIKFDLKKVFKHNIKPNPKYLIHCAVDQRPPKENIANYTYTNTLIFNNLITYAKKNKVELIINLSSTEAYGDIKTNYLKEDYLSQNLNAYGKTKLISEQILHGQKISFVNIRLPGVLCNPINKKFSRPWLCSVLNKIQRNHNISGHNLKNKFNNVISTQEIAKFINFLIKKNIKIRETFNFAGTKPISLKNIFNIAKKKLNSKSKIIEIKNKKKKFILYFYEKIRKKVAI